MSYDVTLFGVYRLKGSHALNLAKLTVGLQFFLSTRFFDNACLQGFGEFEALSLTHDLKTQAVRCGDDILHDGFAYFSHALKNELCQFYPEDVQA